MSKKHSWNKCIIDLLVMLPAIGMALAPFSLEERLNIDFLGYKLFSLMPIGIIAAILCFIRNKRRESNLWLLLLAVWGLFSTIVNDLDNLWVHYFIGIEFIVGYLFASQMRYTEEVIMIIKIISLTLFVLILIQLLSFSLGLGYFSSGQTELESLEGMLRAGSTIGGPTQTGVILVLLVGLIVTLTSNNLLNYLYLTAGLAASLMTGTRSAMIVIIVMILIYALRETRRNLFLIAIGVSLLMIYAYPIVKEMIEAREELSKMQGIDLTSGRTDRWDEAFILMKKNSLGYVFGMGGGTVPINSFQNLQFLSSPHNAFIGLLFQFGIPGFILFIGFLWKKLKVLYRKLSLGSVALIGSVLVCWNTEVITLSFMYSFFFWILLFVEVRTHQQLYRVKNINTSK